MVCAISRSISFSFSNRITLNLDPPIKRFAQRHIYLGTDAIAQRDLGVALARKESTSSAGSLTRTETQQSFVFGTPQGSGKRPPSLLGRRDDSFALHKRVIQVFFNTGILG
jgi:hypothetical protein